MIPKQSDFPRNVCVTGKEKGKVHPITGLEGPKEEKSYSYTLSLTSAQDGGGWSAPRPDRFIPGKENRYPLYRRLGGPQDRSGRLQKVSPPPTGFDPRTVMLVASRYTNYAIPARSICAGTF